LIGLPLRRPVSFLARDSLFRAPIVGWVLRNTYVMPLNREGGAASGIKETLRRMDQGYLVGLFPEGTRSHDGSVGEFKPGFAALLRRSKLPVIPVGIHGAHRALGRRVLSLRPERVCVVFGPPLDRARLDELSKRGREAELIAYVRETVMACQRDADGWMGE
jgi:1-acyl-sn-glycerol-3-phosphate acyltransferase